MYVVRYFVYRISIFKNEYMLWKLAIVKFWEANMN